MNPQETSTLLTLYVVSILALEHIPLTTRFNKAIKNKSKATIAFSINDIILFVVFYPIYMFLTIISNHVSKQLSDELANIWKYILYAIWSPVYFILICWLQMEIYLAKR